MWQCSNCGESLEETFDVCWNCGADRSGAIDGGFRPEPDDPSVPDPGIELPSEPDAGDLSAGGGGMTRREFAALICRTLAVILFALAAAFSVGAVLMLFLVVVIGAFDGSSNSGELMLALFAAVPAMALLVTGTALWKRSDWIAARMVPADPTGIVIPPFTVQDATVVAFSTVGLVFFLGGVREAIGLFFIIGNYSVTAADVLTSSHTWSAIVQLWLSIWLMLGSRGIVATIHRWRNPDKLPEDDDLHERDDVPSPGKD